jgi:hypothetical protein
MHRVFPLGRVFSALFAGSGIAAIVLACGGSSSTSSGSGSLAFSAQSYCDQREARSKNCAPDGAVFVFDRNGCTKDYECSVALYASPDAYFRCRTNPDCQVSASDDRCQGQAGQGAASPQADACAKKYAECKAAGGKTFDSDTCPALGAMNASAKPKIYACIEKPCDQISDCIKATAKVISPSC